MKRIAFIFLAFILFSKFLNGQDLIPVGNGIISSGIYSGTVTYNNNIYCCDGGQIYKWDGTYWSSLGVICNRPILCMEVYNNELYVAGWFTSFNGNSVNKIIKYNGISWQTVGNGVINPSGTVGGIEKMVVYQNKLVLIGGFIQAGTLPVNHIASWDGNNWDSLGSGITHCSSLPSMTVYNNELYVFTQMDTAGGLQVQNASRWNGNNWSAVGTGIVGWPISSVVHDSCIYVGLDLGSSINRSLIVRWDGTNWTNVEQNVSHHGWHYISALSSFNGILYASGMVDTIDGIAVNNVAKLDGGIWNPVDSGVMGSGWFFTVFDDELYLTGDFVRSGSDTVNNVVKFCFAPLCDYGVEVKQSKDLFQFYPNPVSDAIMVETDIQQKCELFIYNMVGELLLNKRLNENLNEIDVRSLSPGLYIIKVAGKDYISQNKLIKN